MNKRHPMNKHYPGLARPFRLAALLLLLPTLVGFAPKAYSTPQKSDPAPVTAPGETTTASAEAVPTPQLRNTATHPAFKSTRFALEVNAGYGMVVSEIEKLSNMSGNPRRGLHLNAALRWASQKQAGVGLRYSGYFSSVQYSDYFTPEGRLQLHIHYIAPELVMRQQVGRRWELHETLGVGYASYGESLRELSESINGFGGHLNFGAEYRLSNHLALGLGVTGYRIIYPNQEILTTDVNTTAGITLFSVNGGIRILF